MNKSIDNAWLRLARTPINPKWNFFCFPFAGGYAEYYLPWSQHLPDCGFYPVQLPGRAARWQEPAMVDISELIEGVLPFLLPLFAERPYVLFGHSMGGHIAYMLAQKIRALDVRQPLCLAISAVSAPSHWAFKPKLSTLSEADFIAFFKGLGGFHPEILKQHAFMALQMKLLRQDVQLCESCSTKNMQPLAYPLLAFSATEDAYVPSDSMFLWQKETRGLFMHKTLPGDHFYLNQQKDTILAFVNQIMQSADRDS